MNLLAISGSLRAQSTNTVLLQSLPLLAPDNTHFVMYSELAFIAPFNPDWEAGVPIQTLRQLIFNADAVLFSVPEYAHGIPGALKNAIDWLVGSGELYRKPAAVYNASSRATYARAAFREVLAAVDVNLCEAAEVTFDIPKNYTPAEIALNPEMGPALSQSLKMLSTFLAHLKQQQ